MKIAVESYKVKDLKVSAELESGHSTREVTTTVTSTTRDFPKEAMFSTWPSLMPTSSPLPSSLKALTAM